MGQSRSSRKPAKPSLETYIAEENANEALKSANRRLQQQLASAKEKSADLVAATLQGARDAYLSVPRVEIPRVTDRRPGKPEGAIWHLTDFQGGKRTNSYNSDVMRRRVRAFWEKAAKITAIQRADHPVKVCAILFGGDMVEGLFNFPTQPFEIDASIFGQWSAVSQLVIECVQAALSIYPEVRVIAEWGNHGRIGSKRDCVPRSDNIDRMVYEHARQMLKGTARLTWEDCPEDIQRVELGNYRAILIHGDEVGRNGFASPMTIVNWVVRQKSGAYPWKFRDAMIGHYHTHATWPLPDGEGSVYQTGSTESENRYAGVMLAAQAQPSQRLHFIDLERGRVTAEYKIHLEK